MSRVTVFFILFGVWAFGAMVALPRLPTALAAPLIAVTAVLFMILFARMRGPRDACPRPTGKAAVAPMDLSPENLEKVFGVDSVRPAWRLRPHAMPLLISEPSKFGGLPDYRGSEQWPRCTMCQEPMTFVGQIAVGPDKPISYPSDATLYIFLCTADPTAEPQCQTWDHQNGGSRCFVQPNSLELLPLGEGGAERQALADAVTRNANNTKGGKELWLGLERKGCRAYQPYLTRQYQADLETVLSVNSRVAKTEEQYALCAALGTDVQIGGFADWVQEPISMTCTCGAPTELVLQFEAFDPAINLGDAGRAYVFACKNRHSADAFFLDWQCC